MTRLNRLRDETQRRIDVKQNMPTLPPWFATAALVGAGLLLVGIMATIPQAQADRQVYGTVAEARAAAADDFRADAPAAATSSEVAIVPGVAATADPDTSLPVPPAADDLPSAPEADVAAVETVDMPRFDGTGTATMPSAVARLAQDGVVAQITGNWAGVATTGPTPAGSNPGATPTVGDLVLLAQGDGRWTMSVVTDIDGDGPATADFRDVTVVTFGATFAVEPTAP